MARLRKAAKLWRRPGAREAAESVFIGADDVSTIDLHSIFPIEAPLEVEIGAGKGDFALARARDFPGRNFLAVELSNVVSRMLAVRCGSAALSNLRVARMDARTLVNLMLPAESVSAYHIYFPDPWPKERHHKHRLFTPFFVSRLKTTMTANGSVYVATDVEEYAEIIFAMLEANGLVCVAEAVPGVDLTAFGRRFIASGERIFVRAYRKMTE